MRKIILICSLSAAHFLLTYILLIVALAAGGHGLHLPGPMDELVYWSVEVLCFPLGTALDFLLNGSISDAWGHIPFILNSGIWGVALYYLGRTIGAFRIRRR
jgi:hypothetical protein